MESETLPQRYGRNSGAKMRRGAYLPHVTADNAMYAVTFRLADSMPRSLLDKWRAEREDILRSAQQAGRPLSAFGTRRLRDVFSREVDQHLDRGAGACWLKDDSIAAVAARALRHFDGDRYLLLAWCVMPNHVHAVVQPEKGHELPDIVHSWKSFSAKRANEMLRRRGRFWHTEYYDHLIRNDRDLEHSVQYVLQNPEKAGLKNWRWKGCANV
ncbi:MAG TPA: transposase [Candidatus Latescibacteria bacterium]|nr:transposase [Candidatus Latescibacterota bacterium]